MLSEDKCEDGNPTQSQGEEKEGVHSWLALKKTATRSVKSVRSRSQSACRRGTKLVNTNADDAIGLECAEPLPGSGDGNDAHLRVMDL